jgi:extradiol dioxygenase family protein
MVEASMIHHMHVAIDDIAKARTFYGGRATRWTPFTGC